MNRHLSNGANNLLRRLVESDDQEMVMEKGAGWWLGNSRVSARHATELIRLCLIRMDCHSEAGAYEIWNPSSDAQKVLEDDGYEPPILAALRRERR